MDRDDEAPSDESSCAAHGQASPWAHEGHLHRARNLHQRPGCGLRQRRLLLGLFLSR